MRTERPAASGAVQAVSGRAVVADFDGGSVISDAGAPLLGQADAAVGLVDRLAGLLRGSSRSGAERASGGAGRGRSGEGRRGGQRAALVGGDGGGLQPSRPVGEDLAPFQPRQQYLPIDEHRLSVEDLPEESVVSAQIALGQGSVPAMASVLRRGSAVADRRGTCEFAPRVRRVDVGDGGAQRCGADASRVGFGIARGCGDGEVRTRWVQCWRRRIDEYIETNVKAGIEAGVEAHARERVEALFEERLVEARAQALAEVASDAFAPGGADSAPRPAGVWRRCWRASPTRSASLEIGDLLIDRADGAELTGSRARAKDPAEGD